MKTNLLRIFFPLLIVLLLTWLYLASEFKKIAENDILPKLDKYTQLVSIDKDSVVIDQYRFNISAKNFKFGYDSLFKIHAGEVKLSYDPFSGKIKINLGGDKITESYKSLETYYKLPDYAITFNRSLLSGDFINSKIEFSLEQPEIYFSEDDSLVSKSRNESVTLSSVLLKDDIYIISVDFRTDSGEFNPNSGYFTKLKNEAFSEYKDAQFRNFIDNLFDEKSWDSFTKLVESDGATDSKFRYSMRFAKKHFDNLVLYFQGEKQFDELFNDFSFTEDTYSLNTNYNSKSSVLKNNINFALSNNPLMPVLKLKAVLATELNSEQKLHFSEVIKGLNSNLFQSFASDLNPASISLLSDMNANIISNIKRFEIESHFKTNRENKNIFDNLEIPDFEKYVNCAVNDLKITTQGEFKDKVYKGKIEISDPNLIIESVVQLYESNFRPFLLAFHEGKDSKDQIISEYDAIIQNIKENGFDTLSALHGGKEDLQKSKKLVMELDFNFNESDFKMNGKKLFDYLTDKRIAKFLEKDLNR
jgi:hypothetical protein